MTLIHYTILGFATYYVALSVSNEHLEGPWGVFQKIRQSKLFSQDDWKGRGIRCIVCVSMYAGVLVAVVAWYIGWFRFVEILVIAPALAGVSVSIDKWWKR